MADMEKNNHHTDDQPMGKEAGLDYTVNVATGDLNNTNKRTVNYLVHRMLWDQQEKIDLDDLTISKNSIELKD